MNYMNTRLRGRAQISLVSVPDANSIGRRKKQKKQKKTKRASSMFIGTRDHRARTQYANTASLHHERRRRRDEVFIPQSQSVAVVAQHFQHPRALQSEQVRADAGSILESPPAKRPRTRAPTHPPHLSLNEPFCFICLHQ